MVEEGCQVIYKAMTELSGMIQTADFKVALENAAEN